MEDLQELVTIYYEPYKISWSEDEKTFFFYCSAVPEFKEKNYILFHNVKTKQKTTFELIEKTEDGFLYHSIGDDHNMKKHTQLLAIRNQ